MSFNGSSFPRWGAETLSIQKWVSTVKCGKNRGTVQFFENENCIHDIASESLSTICPGARFGIGTGGSGIAPMRQGCAAARPGVGLANARCIFVGCREVRLRPRGSAALPCLVLIVDLCPRRSLRDWGCLRGSHAQLRSSQASGIDIRFRIETNSGLCVRIQ